MALRTGSQRALPWELKLFGRRFRGLPSFSFEIDLPGPRVVGDLFYFPLPLVVSLSLGDASDFSF